MTILLIFIIGLCVGSFLNVLVDRIPRGESVLFGRSHCEFCKKKLEWWELLPVISFLIQRGSCTKCKRFIGWQYLVVELVTGISYVFLFLNLSPLNYELGIRNYGEFGYYFFIISIMIVIFFTDLRYGIIPDKVLYPTIIISLFYVLLIHDSYFLIHNYLPSAVGAFLFFLLLFLLTKGRGMGFGDVKFVFLMGLVLGFPGIVIGLYLAFLTGAGVALILVLWGKKKFSGGTIPFGPFLVAGCIAVLLFGSEILTKISPLLP